MTEHPEEPPVPDPWSRYGWLLPTVWLVFLGFPAAAIITEVAGQPLLRAGLLGLLVLFAVVYVLSFGDTGLYAGRAYGGLWVYGGFAGLGAIMVVVGLFIGADALGMSAYLAALAAFGFPSRSAVPGVVGVTIASGLALLVLGEVAEMWPMLLLPALIGSFGLLMRKLIESDQTREMMERTVAVSDERDRVARDVHDVVGHSLTVIALKADLAERLVDIDPRRAKGEAAEIQALTRQSLAEIRATVAGLRVARLADERDAAAAALRDAGIEAEMPEDGDVVDPAHRITLAWVLRESVTNVIRHSGACRVEVSWGPSWLEIVDDGRGLDGQREGSGLTGLRERVGQVGGRLQVGEGVTGRTGPGTSVRVELP